MPGLRSTWAHSDHTEAREPSISLGFAIVSTPAKTETVSTMMPVRELFDPEALPWSELEVDLVAP